MKRIVTVLVLTATLFSACNKSSDAPAAATAANEPKAGSKWVFKISSYNEAGTVTGTSNITLVASNQTYSGSSWILLSDQASGTPVIAIQKRSDGWWQLPLPASTPSLWYKNPAAVNDTYPLTINDGSTDNAKVTSITTALTVPAGSFTDCTKVEGNDTNSLEEEFWFTSSGPIVLKITEWDQKAAGPASNVYLSEAWELVSFTQ
ncbi:MAG: hypothetical protein ACKOU7_05215 [Ferruginibacter sp.]